MKKIGEAYYTNVTYEENLYDLRPLSGHLRVMPVEIPSLNIMFSSREKYSGRFAGMMGARVDLAGIINEARLELRDQVLDGYIISSDEAANFLIGKIRSGVLSSFGFGKVEERSPAAWIGSAKTNIIILFP